jgi:homoserine O-acetyltransferase
MAMGGGIRRLGVTLAWALSAFFGLAGLAVAAPEPTAHDYVIKDFRFRSGESLPELRIHYYTLGTPHRDAAGHVVNAVLILHGTGGTGRQSRSSPTCCSHRAACSIRPGTS